MKPGPAGRSGERANLALATVAFGVCFALWGLIAGLAPIFRARYHLTATQTSLMVAIPVLLGSLGRIPMGILADRFGGRLVFTALLLFGIVPAGLLALDHGYASLLRWGFLLGVMGSSFAVGVAFLTPWVPRARQGAALGIYGLGNIGQSVAVFGGPVLAHAIGIGPTFALFGIVSVLWGLLFAFRARNAPGAQAVRQTLSSFKAVLGQNLVWVFCIFYFLTFGGFVAFGVSLPALLVDMFHLTPADAGARTAGFVVLATVMRPVGGRFADRFGGERLLQGVFPLMAAFAWLLTIHSIYPFTVGALGLAALMGLGNGAVFKLVPQCFPREAGTVTGLVGAAGGLGGFFPPLVLGFSRDVFASYVPGFALLNIFALGCAVLLWQAVVLRLRAPAAGATR